MFAHTAAATDPIDFQAKTPLPPPPGGAKPPTEPAVAAAGSVVLYTGNDFLAVSTDAGRTFHYFKAHSNGVGNVPAIFSDNPDGSGERDQIVQYDPATRTFFWLIQTECGDLGTFQQCKDPYPNRERLAVASYDTIMATGGGRGWRYFDLTPTALGLDPVTWFDRPDMAIEGNYLYISADVYEGCPDSNGFQRCHAKGLFDRVALSDLAAAAAGRSNRAYLVSPRPLDDTVLIHPVQSATGTGYGVFQANDSQFGLIAWPSASTAPYRPKMVDHTTTPSLSCAAVDPSGTNFLKALGDCGGRWQFVGGATQSTDGHIWVAWDAGRELAGSRKRLFFSPFIEVAEIANPESDNPRTLRPDRMIYDTYSAYAFPYLASGPSDEVVMTYLYGGPNSVYPSWGVGFLTGRQDFEIVAQGKGSDERMGDYLTVRPFADRPGLYTAAGYVWTSSKNNPTLYQQPWYALFGRKSDVTPSFRDTARLTMSCPNQVTAGDPINVSGSLSPARTSPAVQLLYQPPDGSNVNHVQSPDSAGSFSDSEATTSSQEGTWEVRARWPGDDSTNPASATCIVRVVAPSPPTAQDSSITLLCSSSNVQTRVDFFGDISPARPDVPVHIHYAADAGGSADQTVFTDLNSHYSGTSPYLPGGYWTIRASWDGDAFFKPATSEFECHVPVAGPPPK